MKLNPKINNDNINFINGHWLDANKIVVSAFDLTVIRGYGVFDFIKSYNKKFLWVDDYLDRFFNSADNYYLNVPYSKKQIKKLLNDALTRNPRDDIYVRIILTGGISLDTLSPGVNNSFIMLINYVHQVDSALYLNGTRFITHHGIRDSPRVKSTNYSNAIYARGKNNHKNYLDILLTDDTAERRIYEGSVNNVFFVKDNKIITAPDDLVLGGIIRNKVIKLLGEMNIEVEYKLLKYADLNEIDEMIATNSSLKVYPVIKVDNIIISKKPGPLTKKLIKSLNEIIINDSKL